MEALTAIDGHIQYQVSRRVDCSAGTPSSTVSRHGRSLRAFNESWFGVYDRLDLNKVISHEMIRVAPKNHRQHKVSLSLQPAAMTRRHHKESNVHATTLHSTRHSHSRRAITYFRSQALLVSQYEESVAAYNEIYSQGLHDNKTIGEEMLCCAA
jgi:hypothetical protein